MSPEPHTVIVQEPKGLCSAEQNTLKCTDFNAKFRKCSGDNAPRRPFWIDTTVLNPKRHPNPTLELRVLSGRDTTDQETRLACDCHRWTSHCTRPSDFFDRRLRASKHGRRRRIGGDYCSISYTKQDETQKENDADSIFDMTLQRCGSIASRSHGLGSWPNLGPQCFDSILLSGFR